MINQQKVDVVGVGLNATDVVIPVKEVPQRGAKIEVTAATTMLGGQVASAIIACRQWGLSTRYVGKFGEDHFAQLHRAEFGRLGVEAHLFSATGATSQQAYILVDESGERTILWKRDPRIKLLPGELQREWVTNAHVLHLDGHDTSAAVLAAKWAREAGVPVVIDLDELYPAVEDLLPNVDYLITSRDIPARIVPDEADLCRSLQEVLRRYRCRLAAATLGSQGVLAWDGSQFHYAPGFRVDVVDTTGAGDMFHAGFIYGLRQSWPLQRQLEFACAAAALNCMGMGARGGIQPVERIQHLMATGQRHPPLFDPAALRT